MRNPMIPVLSMLVCGALALPAFAETEAAKPAAGATKDEKAKAAKEKAAAAKAAKAEAAAAKAEKAKAAKAEAAAAKAAKAAAAKGANGKVEAKPAEAKPVEAKPAEVKPEAKAGGDAGKAVFIANTCNKCHRVTSAGVAPIKEKDDIVDLSGVGAGHDVAWFKKWLKKETDMDSKVKPGEKVKHKGSWKGSDADLDVVAAWLKGLSKK